MATITANISASDTTIPVSAEVDNGFYTIDSENVYVHGSSRGAQGRAFDRLFLSVDRGIGGSTAASHTSGATLTRYYPDAASAGGGGGVEVNSTPVTNIVAPGATIDGDEATLALSVRTAEITWETPNLVDPANNGAEVMTFAEGDLVLVRVIVTEAWDGLVSGSELQLYSGTGSDDPSPKFVGSYDMSQGVENMVEPTTFGTTVAHLQQNASKAFRATQSDNKLMMALYPSAVGLANGTALVVAQVYRAS